MKRLYYQVSNGADVNKIMRLCECIDFIRNEGKLYNYPDDVFQIILNPIWLTYEEYSQLKNV